MVVAVPMDINLVDFWEVLKDERCGAGQNDLKDAHGVRGLVAFAIRPQAALWRQQAQLKKVENSNPTDQW